LFGHILDCKNVIYFFEENPTPDKNDSSKVASISQSNSPVFLLSRIFSSFSFQVGDIDVYHWHFFVSKLLDDREAEVASDDDILALLGRVDQEGSTIP